MSTLATCPRCGRAITAADAGGMVTCECGYMGYLGYLQESAHLAARQRWLQDRIAGGEPPPPEPLATQYGVWKVQQVGTPGTAPPPTRGGSTQVLLVGLGALLVLLAALVFVAVAWELIGPVGRWVGLLLGTALFTGVAIVSRRRTPRTAEALAVVAFGMAAITLAAAPALDVVPQEWERPRYPFWLVVSTALLAFGVLLGRRFHLQAWTWLGWLTAPFVLASALGLGLTRVGNNELDMTLAAIAFLALGTGLLLSGTWPRQVSGLLALVPAAVLTVALLTEQPPAGAIFVVAAALLVLLTMAHGEWREWVGWPMFGFWLALLASMLPAHIAVTAAVAATGGILLFAVVARGPLLALLSALALWTSWLIIRPEDSALLLGIAAVALFAVAAYRKEAAPVAWLGAGFGEAALLLQWDDPQIFEGPTLVLAALLLLAGGLQWRAGTRNSAIVLAPAVTIALLPSALLSWNHAWSQPSLIRFLVVMIVALILLLIGARGHVLGLVVPSTVAIVVAATAQLFATLDLLPRWLALGLVGAVLIVAGARLEWLRERRRETRDWLGSLR